MCGSAVKVNVNFTLDIDPLAWRYHYGYPDNVNASVKHTIQDAITERFQHHGLLIPSADDRDRVIKARKRLVGIALADSPQQAWEVKSWDALTDQAVYRIALRVAQKAGPEQLIEVHRLGDILRVQR